MMRYELTEDAAQGIAAVSTEPAATDPDAPAASARGRLLALAGLVLLVGLVILGRQAGTYLGDFVEWVEGLGGWGPAVFIAGYALATVAFVPGSILTMAGGLLFGLFYGTLYAFAAATIGSTAAFLIARFLARRQIEERISGNDRFFAVDRAIAAHGGRIVLLLRLSPVFPFSLLNYGLGLTKVRTLHYVLASAGMIPGTFLYVYYGKALGSLAAIAAGRAPEQGAEMWIFLVVGLAATVAVTAYVTRVARRALQGVTDG